MPRLGLKRRIVISVWSCRSRAEIHALRLEDGQQLLDREPPSKATESAATSPPHRSISGRHCLTGEVAPVSLDVDPKARLQDVVTDLKAFTATAPLSTPDIGWFVDHAFASKDETADPRIDLVDRKDLAGVAPATVIAAEIDPLRSETEEYAEKLKAAGVAVNEKTFPGVTHEFFGMGKVVPAAKEAMEMATAVLKQAFAKASQ